MQQIVTNGRSKKKTNRKLGLTVIQCEKLDAHLGGRNSLGGREHKVLKVIREINIRGHLFELTLRKQRDVQVCFLHSGKEKKSECIKKLIQHRIIQLTSSSTERSVAMTATSNDSTANHARRDLCDSVRESELSLEKCELTAQ